MRRSAWIAGFLVVAVAAPPTSASAQASAEFPLELAWNAPIECGSAEQVRAELERIAHVRPGLHLTKLAARAEVERRGAGFAVALYTEHEGESGERKLEAADCKTLVRTVTLVLALAFGGGVEVAGDAAPPSGAGSATTPDTAATAARPAELPKTASAEPKATSAGSHAGGDPTNDADENAGHDSHRDSDGAADADDSDSSANDGRGSKTRWALLIGGGAQFALMPSTAFAAALGAELDVSAFSIGLRTTAWPGVSADLTSDVSARFDGLAGQLQGCGRLPFGALTFALCADGRAAALRGRSDGALVDRSSTAPWYALGATAALAWPRDNWLSVRLEAALAASLNRPRFVLENFAEVQRVPLLLPNVGALLVLTP